MGNIPSIAKLSPVQILPSTRGHLDGQEASMMPEFCEILVFLENSR